MSAMHQSWFSYGVSRPYPFRWFTPVVFVGGVLFTVLFSVINLATNGYYLKTIYTIDPNTTIAAKHWYSDAPWSWGEKLKPTCQSQNIPIGYQFFTTNSGFSYTLESVSQYNPRTNETIRLPSVQYLNQTLQNCYIDNVILYMKKNDLSQAGQSAWWSWGDSNGAATAHCTVETPVGLCNVTFSTTYHSDPKAFTYTIRNNYTSAASMWWGTRLLNLYWSSTILEMASAFYSSNDTDWSPSSVWTKGQMTFTPDVVTDIKSYDFFDLQYYFIAGDANIENYMDNLNLMYNNLDLTYSGPLTEGLTWAKIMYSMILTDLGDTRAPNLLLDPSLLQWALQYPGDVFREQLNDNACLNGDGCAQDWTNWLGIAAPNLSPSAPPDQQTPMNQSYDAFKDLMGPLGTKSATIYLQYACSVPERKDGGTLFLAVLIADLVFLQAMWTILNLIAGMVVMKQDNMAMACYAHANQDYGLVGLGMSPVQKMGSKLGVGGSGATSTEGLVGEDGYGRNGYLPVR